MAETRASTPRLTVRGLSVTLPTGRVLIEDLSLKIAAGEVVVLLGASGSGKSTFSRVLFERHELERQGFEVTTELLDVRAAELGLVPQRGALFDHLDVRGNLEVAMRYARAGEPNREDAREDARQAGSEDAGDPAAWLERVGLDPDLAAPGTSVASLSGGQAQRVAVARVLASRRKLLFLDEPSVGLDPHRVRTLARLIREHVATLDLAAIVVTHDIALAAGVADRLYILSPETRRFEPLFADTWPGPLEPPRVGDDERGRWLVELERALVEHIAETPPRRDSSARSAERRERARSRRAAWRASARARAARWLRPFAVAAAALRHLPGHLAARPGDFATVGRRVLTQTLLRPLLFYAVVSVLVGYTVLFGD